MSDNELIETLKAFEEKRVEQLPESARNLFYTIMKIADERDTYKTIIKEVREYLIKHIEEWKDVEDFTDVVEEDNYILSLLDKENK